MDKGLSRRTFITGAGLFAASAVGVGLIGCTTQQADTGSATQNGDSATDSTSASEKGNWSWLEPPAEITDDQIKEELDCEVLILGAGSTGIAASTYTTAQGIDTVIMTKGNTVESLGFNAAAYNSRHNAEFGITYDPGWWRTDMSKYFQGKCNVAMMGNLFDKSGAALDWFADYMNDTYAYAVYTNTGIMGMGDEEATHIVYVWPDTDPEAELVPDWMETGLDKMFEAAQERIEQNGGRFLFSTPAQQLVLDDTGRVVGAIGLNGDNEYIKVNASKGVLLGCGDIVHDNEMLACYCPQMVGPENRNVYGTCTGDGIRMGTWIGAKIQTAPWAPSQTYPHSDVYTADTSNPPVDWFLANTTWMRVNKAGKRFVDEAIWVKGEWEFEPFFFANATQPDYTCYSICDSKYNLQTDPDPRGLTASFEKQVSEGVIKTADTIEELAQLIAVDPQALMESVDRYNSLCDSGVDLDYGVETPYLSPVKEGPFYALKFTVYNSVAFGGLWTNEYMQVVSEDLAVIEGLYAAGNCLGGRSGFYWPPTNLRYTASFKATAMAGGILATRHMLGEWDQDFPGI